MRLQIRAGDTVTGWMRENSGVIQRRSFWFAAHMTGGNGLLRLNPDGGGLVPCGKDHKRVGACFGQIPGPVNGIYRQTTETCVTDKNPGLST